MAYSLRSVFKGSTIYSIGQIATKGITFLLIPLYTYYLSTKQYGIVGYTSVIQQIITILFSFGFYGAQTRYYYDIGSDEDKWGSFLYTGNLFIIIILIAISLLQLSIPILTDGMVSQNIPYNPYIRLTLYSSIFIVMNQIIVTYKLVKKEYFKCVVMQFIQFILITLCSVVFVAVLKREAKGYLEGILYGNIAFFLSFYWSYTKEFRFKFNFRYLKDILIYGLPTVLHLLAGIMNSSASRIILETRVSLSELGVFSLAFQVSMVQSILSSSINQAWQPNYYELMKQNDKLIISKQLKRYFTIYSVAMALLSMGLVLFIDDVVYTFFKSEYWPAVSIIRIIVIGYSFNSLYYFFSSSIFYYKKTTALPLITIASAILNITLCFVLIPKYGLIGASCAIMFALAVQFFGVYCFSNRLQKIEYQIGRVFILLLLPLLYVILEYSIFNNIKNFTFKVIFFIVYSIVATISFKENRELIRLIVVGRNRNLL